MQNYKKLLSNFEIVDFIGNGAMSHVYKIQHKKSKKFYALKEVILERKEDILTVISEKSLACQDLRHPNLMEYQSIVVSTRMEGLKKFRQKEIKSFVDKDILNKYGIKAVIWQRPSSTLTNESVDKQVQFCAKFNENIIDPGEEITLHIDTDFDSTFIKPEKKLRKNSVKINQTQENHFLKKDISLKYYHYLITHFGDFTLSEFINLRNEHYFNNTELKDDLLGKMVKESLINNEVNAHFIDKIMFSIFYGVSFLHSRKIIHGDISSYNVFFIENFEPKLGDYGDSYFGDFRDEKKDLRKLGMLYFEMLVPFNTKAEQHYSIQDLLKKKFPPCFDDKFIKEKKIIEECFSNSARVKDILLLF